jgi:hypothetical protein
MSRTAGVNADHIAAMLVRERRPLRALSSDKARGIYAISLMRSVSLQQTTVDQTGILYVGMTNDDFDARNHFLHEHSGSSTLRRTLGAILKEELDLIALPRSRGSSRSNVQNFALPMGASRV